MRVKNLWFGVLAFLLVALGTGCARESTMTAVVLYENKGASLIQYEFAGSGGYYFLCKDGRVILVRTDRGLLKARIIQTIIIEKSSCQN